MSTVTVQIDNHIEEFLGALESRIPLALEACGFKAEELAVEYCPVDTGLLRNSITFALDGESPQKAKYHADKAKGNATRLGRYQGQAQKEKGNSRAVIVGTNVEYAVFVELGTSNPNYPKQPFLAPAIKNHGGDYRQILEQYLKGGS